MGCSGRWAQFVADKVHILNCIDPSEKVQCCKEKLIGVPKC